MPSTTRGYPYPSNSDRVDIPGDMEAALDAVDSDVGGHVSDTSVHHTLGTGATNAATGNHGHTAGQVSGLGQTIVAVGRAEVFVGQGQDEGYVVVAYTGQDNLVVIATADGSRGVYSIVNQVSEGANAFRITVWYDNAALQDEIRYVNWAAITT